MTLLFFYCVRQYCFLIPYIIRLPKETKTPSFLLEKIKKEGEDNNSYYYKLTENEPIALFFSNKKIKKKLVTIIIVL